jgi:putative component of toxin-antitoxin plasmid stabilization module
MVAKIRDGNNAETLSVHRTQTFDRSLDELRRKGGIASVVAKKADVLISRIMRAEEKGVREQFRLTRNGEYRIKYCRKYDLGSGYRLVFLQRGPYLVLLYAGSHDECFRWIERNKGLSYETEDTIHAIQVICNAPRKDDSVLSGVLEEESFVDEYETALMSRIDDNILRKIFSGLTKQ